MSEPPTWFVVAFSVFAVALVGVSAVGSFFAIRYLFVRYSFWALCGIGVWGAYLAAATLGLAV